MIDKIRDRQREFQKAVGFPIDSIDEKDRNEISEKYIFKAIEELIELRKEHPSVINPWSKKQKSADLRRIQEEFADVILFVINIANVWKLTNGQILSILEEVQNINFRKLKEKQMGIVNSEILKVPGCVSGIGQGNLSPKYVFIGQNPGKTITKGYKFFSNKEDGSSKILLPILEKMGVINDCYFTNAVKCTTEDNGKPTDEMLHFWKEFLIKELNILAIDNPSMKIIAMGSYAHLALSDFPHEVVLHPASIMYGKNLEDYENQIKSVL